MFVKSVLLSSLSFAVILMAGHWSGAIAQSSDHISWRRLSQIGSPKILALIPSRLLSGFENGDVAVTALNSYRTAYVVAKNGINLNITSAVGILAHQNRNRNFNHPEASSEAYRLPAIFNFPESQYNASQLIEFVHYAAKYDGESTRMNRLLLSTHRRPERARVTIVMALVMVEVWP